VDEPRALDDELDPPHWTFDVLTALHDDLKLGPGYPTSRTRVVLSRQAFPDWRAAAETAGCMAVAVHGGMAVDILPRY
jgi:hypothetical protein